MSIIFINLTEYIYIYTRGYLFIRVSSTQQLEKVFVVVVVVNRKLSLFHKTRYKWEIGADIKTILLLVQIK